MLLSIGRLLPHDGLLPCDRNNVISSFQLNLSTWKDGDFQDVVENEVIISGTASDVAWEALRQLGTVEDILSVDHMNRCYRHIRIWKEYVERFGTNRLVKLNLTQVVWVNRYAPRPWIPNDPPEWDQDIITVSVTSYDRKKYR